MLSYYQRDPGEDLVRGQNERKDEKGEGNKCRLQRWLVVWGLAEWIYCISGQVEHLSEESESAEHL